MTREEFIMVLLQIEKLSRNNVYLCLGMEWQSGVDAKRLYNNLSDVSALLRELEGELEDQIKETTQQAR